MPVAAECFEDDMPRTGKQPLRFQRPWLPPAEEIERYFARSRGARWFSNGGPCSELLAARLGERTGAFCVPVANATLGLAAAVSVLAARRPGARRVLLPSFTFPASAQAVLWNGLLPHLLDVEEESWVLGTRALEAALAEHAADVAGVMAVCAFGTPPPSAVRERWRAACAAAGVPLLLDSAAGFGAAADDGVPVGAQADIEVVSFHATKPFAIGEGGAVFCRDAGDRKAIESLINFGFPAPGPRGLNAKLSEQAAATALAVLDRLEDILDRRRRAAADLCARLPAGATLQLGSERSTWQFVPVRWPTPERRRAVAESAAATIEVRRYYEPLHGQPGLDGHVAAGRCPVTEAVWERILCLPMANDLTPAEIELIAASVR